MRFFVAVDAEGLACVFGERGQSLNGGRDLEFAKQEATREASAVARGLFTAGAEEVVVWDNHNGSLNLRYDELDERCLVLGGVGDERRMSIIGEGYDGVVFLGYHAMEGTIDGILAHSYSSVTYQYMKVNGREVGELAIDGAIAGAAGVPVIMVASDRAGCAEAAAFFPWAALVETKRGLGRNMALSKSPARVQAELEETASRAAAAITQMKPFTFDTPVTFEVRYQRADAAEAKSRSDRRYRRLDAFTVAAKGGSVDEFF
jgi:D-amino peptidase